ncbi:MAG: FAD-dependent oxidoreductase [Acidimicrobiia bacterium]
MTSASPESTRVVVVVGAGPAGLSAALALRARGLPALVVEAEPEERVRPGSRAIFVHRESLSLLESSRPGLGHRIADAGLVWPTRRSTFRGRTVFARTYPLAKGGGLPPSTSLPQVQTEELLLGACREAGVEFAWGAPVVGVYSGPEEVVLTTAERVSWVSTYQFVQVVASEFNDRERRVLLVGEAAHLFAPFGARGMNSGIADAARAANGIRSALEDPGAARSAVESFAADRRDAALYNRAAAGAALTHMQAKGLRLRLKRRLAAAGAPRVRQAGVWLDTAPYGPRTGRAGKAGKY